jgi:hypothetical protein
MGAVAVRLTAPATPARHRQAGQAGQRSSRGRACDGRQAAAAAWVCQLGRGARGGGKGHGSSGTSHTTRSVNPRLPRGGGAADAPGRCARCGAGACHPPPAKMNLDARTYLSLSCGRRCATRARCSCSDGLAILLLTCRLAVDPAACGCSITAMLPPGGDAASNARGGGGAAVRRGPGRGLRQRPADRRHRPSPSPKGRAATAGPGAVQANRNPPAAPVSTASRACAVRDGVDTGLLLDPGPTPRQCGKVSSRQDCRGREQKGDPGNACGQQPHRLAAELTTAETAGTQDTREQLSLRCTRSGATIAIRANIVQWSARAASPL